MIGAMIGAIIGCFVLILFGFTLMGPIQQQLTIASQNVTGSSAITLEIFSQGFPILFGLMILLSAIGMVVSTLKGFNHYSEDYEAENEYVEEEKKPHKQTYLEYVQERLAVEKLLRRS